MYELCWQKMCIGANKLKCSKWSFEHFLAYNLGMVMVAHSRTDIQNLTRGGAGKDFSNIMITCILNEEKEKETIRRFLKDGYGMP